ncbi:hypothetical protein [Streptomyces sp. NPDC048650]|uniref:hypothetical protein n=1 Tax=unclassified Streptomyces TaxID=2593676 RepID=UPI0037134A24
MDIARDPALARLLRKQLEGLAEGKGGDVLGEMAKEVLSGRIGLREAVTVGAYQEELAAGIGKFQQKWDEMSEAEKMEAEREGASFIRQQQEEIDQERREAARPQSGHRGHHSGGGWSAY